LIGDLPYIDTRGSAFTVNGVQPVFPLLKDLDADIVASLMKASAYGDEILDDADWFHRMVAAGSNLKFMDGSNSYGTATFSSSDFIRQATGLDPDLPIGEFYIPRQRHSTNTTTAQMIQAINKALQLEHAANNPAPGAQQSDIDKLRLRANSSWIEAHETISAIHKSSISERDKALDSWRHELTTSKKRNKATQDKYIFNGAITEQAEHILQKHFVNNPSALAALEDYKRKSLEGKAKRANERARRIASRQTQGPTRAAGLHDASPFILDPWSSMNPSRINFFNLPATSPASLVRPRVRYTVSSN
jgi:hypothetical protein